MQIDILIKFDYLYNSPDEIMMERIPLLYTKDMFYGESTIL